MVHLYHTSLHSYSSDELVTASPRTVTGSLAETVERVLEERRPSEALGRSEALYAFHSSILAARYGYGEYKKRGFHVYRVLMESPERHPMALVDAIAKRADDPGKESVTEIADEYWVPSDDWRVWEHLAREMTVLEEIDPPAPMIAGAAGILIMEDQHSIRTRWPEEEQEE